ncbi:MAG: hypothetical protein M3423_06010 [Actinomycetota bacterium]|nr:hypothetical protein [Actinomycetota bacterium]
MAAVVGTHDRGPLVDVWLACRRNDCAGEGDNGLRRIEAQRRDPGAPPFADLVVLVCEDLGSSTALLDLELATGGIEGQSVVDVAVALSQIAWNRADDGA